MVLLSIVVTIAKLLLLLCLLPIAIITVAIIANGCYFPNMQACNPSPTGRLAAGAEVLLIDVVTTGVLQGWWWWYSCW